MDGDLVFYTIPEKNENKALKDVLASQRTSTTIQRPGKNGSRRSTCKIPQEPTTGRDNRNRKKIKKKRKKNILIKALAKEILTAEKEEA